MTQPRLASPHTSCWLNHWSTSVSFPFCHLHHPSPSASTPPSLPLSVSVTAGLQGDSRSQGQQKRMPTPHSVAVKNKRGPGRPRKHPLPSTVSSPTLTPSAAPSVSSSNLLPEHAHYRDEREVGGRKEERGPERNRGGDTVQQVSELELQARRKRGRKRKHGDSPCLQR